MKISTRPLLAATLALVPWLAQPVSARDKEHQQIAADVRMLQVMQQEQSQQMQSLLAQLGEALKAVSQRLDDQAKASVKSFADQKLVIDALQRDLGVLREKVDDSNTRLGSVSQEVEALRQGLQQALQASARAAAAATDSTDLTASTGAGGNGDSTSAAAPGGGAPGVAVGTSPNRLYDMAYSNYTSGLWDLTIDGFNAFIRSFPKSDMADDAQVYIGNAYLQDGKNDKAVEAYDLAIRTYPSGNAIPEAFYKKGLALKNLKQMDLARQAWEYVVKTYEQSTAALLAKQQLQQLIAPTGR
ncbi:MAG: outer membrane protein assembly factor BamD [Acidobacteriota bacterium]